VASETVSVDILGKDYQVACPSDEREALIHAAAELDRRMTVIRQSGSVIGVERIAVMAALNLAHEVLDPARTKDANKSVFEQKLISNMCQRVDALLVT
jgi:cell division protein ZapA